MLTRKEKTFVILQIKMFYDEKEIRTTSSQIII